MSPDVSRRAALATLGTASLIGVVASSSVGGSNHDGISAGSGGPIRNWGVGLRADRPAEANSHERDVWVAIDGPNSYIGDDGTWHDLNVGGSSNPVPEGHFESVNTDKIDINQFSTGYSRVIFSDENFLYAADENGKVVAGGPESVNVTDATDFGQVFEEAVNGVDSFPSVFLAPANNQDQELDYRLKSKVKLTENPTVFSAGKNRAGVIVDESLGGETAIEVVNPDNPFISRWDSVQISAAGVGSDQPDTILYVEGLDELNLTNCEFRDAQNWGVDARDIGQYNIALNCWFLAGAGLHVDTADEFRLIANRFVSSRTTNELNNVNNIIRRGNNIYNNATLSFSNCTFDRPDEEFGTVDATHGDFSSIQFPIQAPNNVESNRLFDTWYQNNTGHPLYISVSITVSTGSNVVRAQLENSPDGTFASATIAGLNSGTSTSSEEGQSQVIGVVPDGDYYRVRQFGDTSAGSIQYWTEAIIGDTS